MLFLIIIGGGLISSYTKANSMDSTTSSTKVEVNSHRDSDGSILYSPTYYYMVDGREYSCSSSSSSSINPGTSNKTVYYDSKNPSNCMTEYSKSNNKTLLIFLLLPLLCIVVAVVNIRKIGKRVKLINDLNQKGKLVKNLPYHLEDTGMAVNNVHIQRPVVEYTLPSGSVITLYGDPRHDRKVSDADGMVDLVIDENNPNNYFIDFEINRLTGNLPTDYYSNIPNNEVQSSNMNYQTSNQYQNTSNNNINANLNNNFNNFQESQTISQQNQPQIQINQQTYISQNDNNQNNS